MTYANALSRLVILVAAALLSIGCDTRAPMPAGDAGIQPVDGGDVADAFVAPDAGDGVCGEVITAGFGPLPASCLPRCSADTEDTVEACADAEFPAPCVMRTSRADTTPTVMVRTSDGLAEVSCGTNTPTVYSCIVWQFLSCEFDLCPDEWNAWVTCVADGRDCTAELDTVEICATGHPGFRECFTTRGHACYP